jgi:hypothetical protein
LATGVGIAPTPAALQPSVQTDSTIQQMGFPFGRPRESVSTGSGLKSLGTANQPDALLLAARHSGVAALRHTVVVIEQKIHHGSNLKLVGMAAQYVSNTLYVNISHFRIDYDGLMCDKFTHASED